MAVPSSPLPALRMSMVAGKSPRPLAAVHEVTPSDSTHTLAPLPLMPSMLPRHVGPQDGVSLAIDGADAKIAVVRLAQVAHLGQGSQGLELAVGKPSLNHAVRQIAALQDKAGGGKVFQRVAARVQQVDIELQVACTIHVHQLRGQLRRIGEKVLGKGSLQRGRRGAQTGAHFGQW